jgi:PAS domain S-box-containing protein
LLLKITSVIRSDRPRGRPRVFGGMENIATAIAEPGERRVAFVVGLVIVAIFSALLPVASMPLKEIPAFIPAVFSAAALAQVLTAILFFVQWRISGLAQLALLALAFASAALTGAAWVLTYPSVFSTAGLLGAGHSTSGWMYVLEQSSFGALIIAYAILDRFPRSVSRGNMRVVGAIVFAVVIAGIAACIVFGNALPATANGRALTPIWSRVLVPFLIGEYIVVLAVVASTGIRTVAHVWVFVVCACKLVEIFSSGSISAERFALGWYLGRMEHLVSSSLLLYVFFVKINDLLVRLASRNRRLTERTESDAAALAEGEQRYRLLTNTLPQLIWTTDAAGELDYVNQRWTDYSGLDLSGSQHDEWMQCVHPADRDVVRQSFAQALTAGGPLTLEYRIRDRTTGRYRWFLINALAVRDRSGAIARWIATSTDIDGAKRLEEREGYLATAGERLAASIDIATTLNTVTDLCVPDLCDWCQIDLIDEDGRFVPAAVASTNPLDADLLQTLVGHPVETRTQEALERIISRGEPVVIGDPHMFAETLPNVRDRAVYRRVASTSAIIVPLRGGESRIGTLSLVFSDDREISVDDVGLARDFARRAALALEHARLYERERSTADALQRAMLPAQLPLLEHIKFSASYSAASESQRVGGDFYDAFELPDGRVALTIGDVTGHGLQAAVIMGEIRQALRAAAFERAEPSAILDRASRLLVASGRTVFVTAIFGVLDTQTGKFAYATAGHPPPLLFDGTRVIRLASSGLPIGLREDDGVDFSLALHAPCTLTLFTDGLIEFARDLDDGERRIEAAIRELNATETEHLADAIMKRVLGSDEATDDIAILTATIARFPDEIAGEEREWRFLSVDARAAALARREIGELIAPNRPDERFIAELAFGELVANAVRHAPGPVVVRCRIAPGGAATLELDDAGSGFVLAPNSSDLLAETGRGLELIRRLTGDVHVASAPGGGASVRVRFGSDRSVN